MRKVIVSVCLSVHTQQRIPHLHPIILPMVPCLFQGVPQYRYTLSQAGMGYPQPGMEYPLARMGYPQQGWGTPHTPGYDNRRSTCYAAGSMPLVFTQEDFIVEIFNHNYQSIFPMHMIRTFDCFFTFSVDSPVFCVAHIYPLTLCLIPLSVKMQ